MCPICFRVFNSQSSVERCFGKHEKCDCERTCNTLNDYIDAHMIEEESCPFQQEGKKLNITQKREFISKQLDNNELTVTAVQLEKLDDFHSNI